MAENEDTRRSELERRCNERTLVLCKPESVVLGEYPEILARIQKMHLKTPLIRQFKFTERSIMDFYGHVVDRYEGNRDDMISLFMVMTENPTIATVVQGPNSIDAMRKLAGGVPEYVTEDGEVKFSGYNAKFMPLQAPPGTIRGDFSSADVSLSDLNLRPLPNYMHASDSPESYEREVGILMKHEHISEQDFFDYKRPEWKFLFGVE